MGSDDIGCGCGAVIGVVLFTLYVVTPIMSKLLPYKADCAKAADARLIIAEYEKSVAMATSNAVASAEEAARNKKKVDKIRTFALTESPTIWQTVQKLRAEKESLETGIAKVEAVLHHYGHDVRCDIDVAKLKQELRETDELHERLWTKLEDAYLKYVAYQEMPGQEDLKDLCDKALSDGALEASVVEKRFIRMREQK